MSTKRSARVQPSQLQNDMETDLSSTDQSDDSEFSSTDLSTSSSSSASSSEKRQFGTNRDSMGNFRYVGGGDAGKLPKPSKKMKTVRDSEFTENHLDEFRSKSEKLRRNNVTHVSGSKEDGIGDDIGHESNVESEVSDGVGTSLSYLRDLEEDLQEVDERSKSDEEDMNRVPLAVAFQGEQASKLSKVNQILKVKKNALQKGMGNTFSRPIQNKSKKVIHDGVFNTMTNLRYKKNAVSQRLRPHALRLQHLSHRTGSRAKVGITKFGIWIALNGVRLITRQRSTSYRSSLEENSDQCPYGDPFDFDMDILRHQPVTIPRLALAKEDTLMDADKPSDSFSNMKNARYAAIINQAASKHTKELTLLLKNKQGRPKEILETSVSIGPRLHIGFKCDIEKQSLTIRIMEATGLPGKDSNGLADPYCVITLKPDAAIEPLRTRTIGKTVNPKWKEIFELSGVPPVATLQKQTLHIQVYDYDQLGADDLIGTLDIGLVNYDLIGGAEMWLDLRTKETTEKPKHYGNALIGLRYDPNQEKLTVYIERCEALDKSGCLITKACLHINGYLVKMRKSDPEKTSSLKPELKQRIAFRHIKKTLLDEYAVTVYFAFRHFLVYNKHFGQINLSCKSKDHSEAEIWEEARKLPGEVAFKLLTIHPFLGLIKKPWKPVEDLDSKKLGFLSVTLKVSVVVAGMLLSCTIEKAEELALPKRTFVKAELYLIKDALQVSHETTKYKKISERTTPFEETFDLYVDMDEIGSMGLVVILSRRHWFWRLPFAQLSLSTMHKTSVVPEMELWQSAVKSAGVAGTRKLELRPLRPEITLYRLGRSGEVQVTLREASLLPEKETLGELVFSLSYHESKEHLKLVIERVKNFPHLGKYYIRAFLWDLKKNRKKLQRSIKFHVANNSVIEFKTAVKFKNVHSSFFDSHFLCIRLLRSRLFWFPQVAGQTVIKIVKITPYSHQSYINSAHSSEHNLPKAFSTVQAPTPLNPLLSNFHWSSHKIRKPLQHLFKCFLAFCSWENYQ